MVILVDVILKFWEIRLLLIALRSGTPPLGAGDGRPIYTDSSLSDFYLSVRLTQITQVITIVIVTSRFHMLSLS